MNSINLFFYLAFIWSCVACVWPPEHKDKSYLEKAFIHDANIGGSLGAGVGGGCGATLGAVFGGETGASLGAALGGAIGGAIGGFTTGGPVGAISGVIGGSIGSASGANIAYRKAQTRGCGILGKTAAARLGGILGGLSGGYYGIGGYNAKRFIPGGMSIHGLLQMS